MIAFTRALIRECPSGTKVKLALFAARSEVDIGQEELAAFCTAIEGEAAKSKWPKGFF